MESQLALLIGSRILVCLHPPCESCRQAFHPPHGPHSHAVFSLTGFVATFGGAEFRCCQASAKACFSMSASLNLGSGAGGGASCGAGARLTGRRALVVSSVIATFLG